MKINFSKCSNDDVAELLFACYEECYWLCETQHEGSFPCLECPGSRLKTDVCCDHSDGYITKPEIARQCHEEILRREPSEEIQIIIDKIMKEKRECKDD